MKSPVFAILLAASLLGQESGDPKRPYKNRPDDTPRRHVEIVRQSGRPAR